MKTLLLASLVLFLTGCNSLTYRNGETELTRRVVGTQTGFSELGISMNEHGLPDVQMKGYVSDQIQIINAIAEGVANGLITQLPTLQQQSQQTQSQQTLQQQLQQIQQQLQQLQSQQP